LPKPTATGTKWWPPLWGGSIDPPGTAYSILPHFADPVDRAIEVAVFQQHRFAFYFWAKWEQARRRRRRPWARPHLVTLDWHQDLCAPGSTEQDDLRALDLDSEQDVGLFCWSRLNPLNDGQILAAAFAGLIGDIFVLCKHRDDYLRDWTDMRGDNHRTVLCHSLDDFIRKLPATGHVYLDLDLDYFTESDDAHGGGPNVRMVPDDEVRAVVDPAGPLMRQLLPRTAGMTIATEPTWCGGMRNSNHLFGLVDEALFDPPLLHDDADWRDPDAGPHLGGGLP